MGIISNNMNNYKFITNNIPKAKAYEFINPLPNELIHNKFQGTSQLS